MPIERIYTCERRFNRSQPNSLNNLRRMLWLQFYDGLAEEVNVNQPIRMEATFTEGHDPLFPNVGILVLEVKVW